MKIYVASTGSVSTRLDPTTAIVHIQNSTTKPPKLAQVSCEHVYVYRQTNIFNTFDPTDFIKDTFPKCNACISVKANIHLSVCVTYA